MRNGFYLDQMIVFWINFPFFDTKFSWKSAQQEICKQLNDVRFVSVSFLASKRKLINFKHV